MPLPAPKLDDRTAQQLIDQAKLMITRYCPEWTDHNVSDPGVALIEMFAWMTELLLYRVNQVPEKNYVKFLELIGIKLGEPKAATVPVTFYVSAAQQTAIPIPAGTEVATVRTEVTESLVFTTEKDVTIVPPELIGAYRVTEGQPTRVFDPLDLNALTFQQQPVAVFPNGRNPGDGFWLVFKTALSEHVLALTVQCETALGRVDFQNPPIEWHVWQNDIVGWAKCEKEYDGTGGFNRTGEIILRLPTMGEHTEGNVTGYMLRCRLTAAQAGDYGYKVVPQIQSLQVESRGITVAASHATSVKEEFLGLSKGTPGQEFRLQYAPVLPSKTKKGELVVEVSSDSGTSKNSRWMEVEDFGDSTRNDYHYVMDHVSGQITFGPTLLQPDGTMYSFGAIPPRDAKLIFKNYQYGGGAKGNVPPHTITVMKSALAYIARVTNHLAAQKGLDAETVEAAKMRAPSKLRTRTRAVTADDFEYFTIQVPGVARCCCLAPGEVTGDIGAKPAGQVASGQVYVAIVPRLLQMPEQIGLKDLVLTQELINEVKQKLRQHSLVGIKIDTVQPIYKLVKVQATLRCVDQNDEAKAELQKAAEQRLHQYLNPLTGGLNGTGWPFGAN